MKRLILFSFLVMLLLSATSCRTTVVAGRPAPRPHRHYWWHRHPPVHKEVIIIK